MSDLTAARDALLGVQEAYDRARRTRLMLIRRVAAIEVESGHEPAHQVLVEALLRREAADADDDAPLAARLGRVLAEARDARDARERLAGEEALEALLGELDRTWEDALGEATRLVAQLRGRTSGRIADAFDGYVAALAALHGLGPDSEATDVAAACEGIDAAVARLEDILRPAGEG